MVAGAPAVGGAAHMIFAEAVEIEEDVVGRPVGVARWEFDVPSDARGEADRDPDIATIKEVNELL